MVDESGKMNVNALRIRITDSYVETLSRIYDEVKLVGIPAQASGAGSADSGNPLSTENLATAMVMLKHVGVGGKD